MTSRDFVYWLQGYFEIAKPDRIDKKEIDMIEAHLKLVFNQNIKLDQDDMRDTTGTFYPTKIPDNFIC